MAIKDCIDEIRKVAGDKLSEQDIEDIAREVDRRARSKRARDASMNSRESLEAAADDIAAENDASKAIAKRNRALDLVRAKERDDFYRQAEADKFRPDQAIEAKMSGIERQMKGGRNSTDAQGKANEGFFLGGLSGDLRKAGVLKLFTARLGILGDFAGITDKELNRALWSINDAGKVTLPGVQKDTAKIAEVIHKWLEIARLRANRAGAAIRKLPGYIARQSWDMAKIREMGKEKFVRFMLPLLDHDQTFQGKDPEAFLSAAYDAMSSGVHIRAEGNFGFKGSANIAKRISHERLLHFKDADSWTLANQTVGLNSTAEAVISQLRHEARNIALMDTWGTNPRQNFDDDLRMLQMRHRDNPQWVDKLKAKKLQNIFDNLDGSVNIADSTRLANWSSNIRGLQDVAKLPLAAFSHLNILATAASELRHEGEGLGQSYANFLSSFVENAGGDDKTGLISDLGVAYESMAGAIASRFSASDQQPGTMGRILRTYFKLNGMRFAIETARSAFGQTIGHNLGRDAALTWDKLKPAKRDLFEQYGIDGNKWEAMRRGAVKLDDGRVYLSPDAIGSLPDDAFTNLGAKSPRAAQRLRDELSTTLRSLIQDRTDHAVPTPGARERSIMNRGLRKGTVEGELFRFAWQFKQFPLTLWNKVVMREIGKFQDGRGDILGVAHLIAATTLMGMFAMQSKQMLKGRTPRDPFSGNWPAVWGAALQQGGGAGIYGDFLFGQVSDVGGSFLETAAGPTFGTASRLGGTLVGLTQTKQDAEGNLSPKTTPADLLKLATDNMPNLFYTRLGLDYLVLYQLQEMASPGYLKRMETRLRQQSNQTMILPPSELIPRGGGRLLQDNRLLNGSLQ